MTISHEISRQIDAMTGINCIHLDLGFVNISEIYQMFKYCDAWSQKILNGLQVIELEKNPNREQLGEFQIIIIGYWTQLKRDAPEVLSKMKNTSKK